MAGRHDVVSLIFAVGPAGDLVSVDDVPNGLNCACVCPLCREPLIARQGEVLAAHFAHQADSTCVGAYETMAHLLAKQIIARSPTLRFPALIRGGRTIIHSDIVTIQSVDLEKRIGDIQPDAMVTVDGREIAVEIHVAHAVGLAKRWRFAEIGLAAFEIDLRIFREGLEGRRFQAAVLVDARREWLWHPESDKPRAKPEDDMRAILEANAKVALAHATSRGDAAGIALVNAWFDHFNGV